MRQAPKKTMQGQGVGVTHLLATRPILRTDMLKSWASLARRGITHLQSSGTWLRPPVGSGDGVLDM